VHCLAAVPVPLVDLRIFEAEHLCQLPHLCLIPIGILVKLDV
jgi:hypothetical protein